MGTQLPIAQRGTAPQFSAHICCGQTGGWIKIPLGREVSIGPGDIVSDDKGAQQLLPHFSDHVCCSQTAGWIKLPLGVDVGLGPGVIVLGRDPAAIPPKGAQQPPTLRPMSVVAKRSPISATDTINSK